jgi:hypothetical protein
MSPRSQRTRTMHHSLRDPNNSELRELPPSLLVKPPQKTRGGQPNPDAAAVIHASSSSELSSKRVRSPSIEEYVPDEPMKKKVYVAEGNQCVPHNSQSI